LVKTTLKNVEPAITVTVKNLTFNSDFVLSNGSFLEEYLVDYALQRNLSSALEQVTNYSYYNKDKAKAMTWEQPGRLLQRG
jgi:hypothetical protein